ncbi:hypothetical protein BBJ28_00022742 [Nothophytophthora sp. Chile5]|nr:hypothetical protein BBJ28_00022742 [Nothophytophthora sp. Chile5]
MILNLSFPQLLFLPPLLLVVSGLALYNFQSVFRFLTMSASAASTPVSPRRSLDGRPHLVPCLLVTLDLKGYMTIPAVQTLKPCKASTFKFNVSHVLMMAVLIMLVAVYEAIQKNNQLQEQQLKLLAARQKKRE